MELIDFIKALIEKPAEYKKLRQYEKAKFFFMTQRFMSINFPIQAQMFNHIRVPQAEVLDYWHDNLTRLYKRTPGWIFTKGSGGKKKQQKAAWPSDEAVAVYLNRKNMTRRDLDDAVNLFGEEALKPIHRIDELNKENA